MNYEKFEPEETVVLDKNFNNHSEVEVVSQTLNRMFTRVKDENSDWEVMTNRLTKL